MNEQYGEAWLKWAIQVEEEAGCDINAGLGPQEHPLTRKPGDQPMNEQYGEARLKWAIQVEEEAGCDISAGLGAEEHLLTHKSGDQPEEMNQRTQTEIKPKPRSPEMDAKLI